MAKKMLAIVLTVLMVLCVVPFAAFAEEDVVTTETRVAAWNANYALVLDKLASNDQSAHWKYVDQNKKVISDKMITMTAFALYDDAWANGIDKSIDVETAEKMLVSIIEKVDVGIGDSKVAEIVKVLETATDINDFLQKVNGYINVSDVLKSAEWSNAFKVINASIKVGHFYEEQREKIIDAYARILAVQAANDFYLDFLQYVAKTCSYDVVVTAANKLINHIGTSINDLVKAEFGGLAIVGGNLAVSKALEVAMNSNAYTAVALKVYQVGTSVADVLWNTSDLYPLMQELYTIYHIESSASDWYSAVVASGNDDYIEYAVNTMLSLREIGLDTLYNLKNAENTGIVGKISNQINYNISFEYVVEEAFLELAREVLFNIDIADFKPITSIVTVCSDAYVHTSDISLFNQKGIVKGNDGFYSVFFNDGTKQYVKTLFLTADDTVDLLYGSSCLATVIVEKLTEYGVVDYSFTSETVALERNISFNTANTEYTVSTPDEVTTVPMNDEFVYPAYNAVTVKSVANATKAVINNEAQNKIIELRVLIQNIIDTIKQFFKTIFAPKVEE